MCGPQSVIRERKEGREKEIRTEGEKYINMVEDKKNKVQKPERNLKYSEAKEEK